MRFEDLIKTPAAHDALARLREATRTENGPMERHCLRVLHIARELGQRRGLSVDEEALAVAAILHDIGLYPSASRGGVYTADGAALAREVLREHGWQEDRIERCAQAIDRHHDIRNQLPHGAEVEVIRRADLVDVSGGLVRFGLERRWLRGLKSAVPRRGLGAELFREVGRAVRERPLTLPKIFRRP